MDGLLIIDKASGLTSHDVVAEARHILQVRRIGHTGTLDPFATGVLVLLIGRATRLAQFLSDAEKEYEAVIRFGYATDTADRTGKRIEEPGKANAAQLSIDEIQAAMQKLIGEIDQVPPMHSAKKSGGKKLYELARRGEEIERAPVRISIQKFEPVALNGKLIRDNLDGTIDVAARVVCSAGTYIRTLAEDLGKLVGVGAHLAELRRTRAGNFAIDNARTLEQVKVSFAEEALGTILVPPAAALSAMPSVEISDEDTRLARNGMDVNVSDECARDWSDGERVRILDAKGTLIAVGFYSAAKQKLHPAIVVAEENQRGAH